MSSIATADWIARVATAGVFDVVGDSADAAESLAAERITTPAAYVAIAAEDANEITTGSLHLVTGTVAVLYIVAMYGGQNYTGSVGLDAVKVATRGVLVGWRPSGLAHPVQLESGALLSALDSGLFVWQDNFSYQYMI